MDPPLKWFALTTPSLKGVSLFLVTNSLKGICIALIIINNYTLLFFFSFLFHLHSIHINLTQVKVYSIIFSEAHYI